MGKDERKFYRERNPDLFGKSWDDWRKAKDLPPAPQSSGCLIGMIALPFLALWHLLTRKGGQ